MYEHWPHHAETLRNILAKCFGTSFSRSADVTTEEWVVIVGAGATALGVVVGVIALWWTRASSYAADRQVKAAERTIQLQEREALLSRSADLQVTGASLRKGEGGFWGEGLWLGVDLRNNGRSAAYSVEVSLKYCGVRRLLEAVTYRPLHPDAEVWMAAFWEPPQQHMSVLTWVVL